jgi:hypothetical protein
MSRKENLKSKVLIVRFISILAISTFLLGLISCADEKPPPPEKTLEKIDVGKLTGRWLRPDGGYIIEILNVHDEGTLEAAYYNPQPINIAQAKWKAEDNRLKIFIKFDDVNYPGSTYTLDYFPDRDLLIGAYFQATQQQTYYVEFIRQNN